MAACRGAGLRRDGSGAEADDGDGNNMGASRVPAPRRLCALGYLRRDVRTTERDGGKEGAFSNRTISLFISGT